MTELSKTPYVVAEAGSGPRTWHIPGPGGDKPLCGAVLVAPERRYLPSQVPAADVTCDRCLALHQAQNPNTST